MTVRPFLLALCLCIAAAPCGGQTLPDLGDISSATLSEQQERTIGNRIMRDVRVDKDFIDDPEIADYINALGQRLLAVADPPRREIDFFVVRDESVNAFALVGGHIGVHTGLVLLTQSESELAGVLAHEIAHVLQKHQARVLAGQSRSSWTSLAALALALIASRSGGSQASQVTEAAVATAGALQIQTAIDYTREHEREADRVGLTLLQRAGFNTRAMSVFFERMLRANRLNEFKGAPSYLRTHPLTTERIADIQQRIDPTAFSAMVVDSFEYRLARARIRAMSDTPAEAVKYFREELSDKTILRPREDVYGLALALRRTRDLETAWTTLEPIRKGDNAHPSFHVLAGQLKADMRREGEALEIYRAALKSHPGFRSLAYAYNELLQQMGRNRESLADLEERLRGGSEDARLYELQARAMEASGRAIGQHRAQAEAYFRRGNLAAAVDQLEIAVKQVRGSDFYELSIAESRLRELRVQLENERAAEKALKIS
ncbi:MAG TPA: M48 family metalloprotease [Usitatibacter sp.]|nr:M48 family metalloprotease [Usitatibacter sp.]